MNTPDMHPKELSIKDFTYTLPEERIADYPLQERDASKLLVYKAGNIQEDIYKNIASHLPEHSLLVFNNTKVIPARLLFQKSTGGVIEIFCLEPTGPTDISTAMLQRGHVRWQCLVGGASKWRPGQLLVKSIAAGNEHIQLTAKYISKETGSFVIELSWSPAALSFAEILQHAGAIPLPPYIKREAEASDAERYQTIYAQYEGSVAAPTAGLHFTDAVFKTLAGKHIHTGFVTLHVGAGTFKPVKSETMAAHDMHAEYIEVSRSMIKTLLQHQHPVVAVGTTSLRTLESLYWLGVKAAGTRWSSGPHPVTTGPAACEGNLSLDQWEAYELAQDMPVADALRALLQYMDEQQTEKLLAKTKIIIAPGYRPRIIKGLVTNFHQPQSTLLLLIAALVGDNWKKIYHYAMEHQFRFLSYGDGCLLWL